MITALNNDPKTKNISTNNNPHINNTNDSMTDSFDEDCGDVDEMIVISA
jgi:hypothetical protein